MHSVLREYICLSVYFIAFLSITSDKVFADKTYELSGKVNVTKVIDGDSFRSGKLRIRIFGIDAPELKQHCQDKHGVIWACGTAALSKLENIIGQDMQLKCYLRDIDQYGRLIMQCFEGEIDIGAAMVKSGNALSYRKYSKAYTKQESQAKIANAGLWRGNFIPPWEWRKQN